MARYYSSARLVLAWVPLLVLVTALAVGSDGQFVRELYERLALRRAEQIARLHDYAARGEFPINTYISSRRVPVFVDRGGTACAVGHLMRCSGADETVSAIARANNHVRVMDVTNGPLVEWILASGLTQEECALIQPTYDPSMRMRTPPEVLESEKILLAQMERLRIHFTAVEEKLRADSKKSLQTALSRLVTNKVASTEPHPWMRCPCPACSFQTGVEHIPALLEALQNSEPVVRIGAAEALRSVVWVDGKKMGMKSLSEGDRMALIPPLVENLRHSNVRVGLACAESALEILRTIGTSQWDGELLAPCAAALHGNDPEHALKAIDLLSRIPGSSYDGRQRAIASHGKALELLYSALRHPDSGIRAAACMKLWGNTGFDPLLNEVVAEARAAHGQRPLGTALHAAAEKGDIEAARAQLKDGADASARNPFGHSALDFAAAHGHAEVIRLLVEHCADVNATRRRGARTALHAAAVHGQIEAIKALLELHAEPNAQDSAGATPLHDAAIAGKPEAIKLLLDAGADIPACQGQIPAPQTLAARAGHAEALRVLLAEIARRTPRGPSDALNAALHAAVRAFQVPAAKLLLEAGAAATSTDDYHMTPLHYAAEQGCTEIARLLLDAGADPSPRGMYGRTPLHLAAIWGHESVSGLLLQKGADPNARESYDRTPLHEASHHCSVQIVAALLKAGADVKATEKFGSTALHLACCHDGSPCARLLLEHGSDVNARNAKGQTPLHIVNKRCAKTVELLLAHGADPNKKDNQGKSAEAALSAARAESGAGR